MTFNSFSVTGDKVIWVLLLLALLCAAAMIVGIVELDAAMSSGVIARTILLDRLVGAFLEENPERK